MLHGSGRLVSEPKGNFFLNRITIKEGTNEHESPGSRTMLQSYWIDLIDFFSHIVILSSVLRIFSMHDIAHCSVRWFFSFSFECYSLT